MFMVVFWKLVKLLIWSGLKCSLGNYRVEGFLFLFFTSCLIGICRVCWGPGRSKSFGVSNGVRQGGVFFPLLFSVYMDGLIEDLSESGVGCYWGHHFVGTFCYADDVVLLAPCASALRRMLNICSCYASSHGLVFNASKTQLICFHSAKVFKYPPTIKFENVTLKFTDTAKYLGIIQPR